MQTENKKCFNLIAAPQCKKVREICRAENKIYKRLNQNSGALWPPHQTQPNWRTRVRFDKYKKRKYFSSQVERAEP